MAEKVIFLGTSSGVPTIGRSVSSIAVQWNNKRIWLFDMGEGTQLRFMQAKLSWFRVEKIFITHLHGDHCFGLPGFLAMLTMHGIKHLIEVVGPAGVKDFVQNSLKSTSTFLNYQIQFTELEPDRVHAIGSRYINQELSDQFEREKIVSPFQEEKRPIKKNPPTELNNNTPTELNDNTPTELNNNTPTELNNNTLTELNNNSQETELNNNTPTEFELNNNILTELTNNYKPREATEPIENLNYPDNSTSSNNPDNSKLHSNEIQPVDVVQFGKNVKRIEIVAAPLLHRVTCFGYVLKEWDSEGEFDPKKALELGVPKASIPALLKNRKIAFLSSEGEKKVEISQCLGPPHLNKKLVILGDTIDSSRIIPDGVNCDLLVHECTFATKETKKCQYGQHSNPPLIADFCARILPKNLIITHFSARYTTGNPHNPTVSDLLQETKTELVSRFSEKTSQSLNSSINKNPPPNVFAANDLDVYEIKQVKRAVSINLVSSKSDSK